MTGIKKSQPLKMTEIYSGKDEEWKGWHNLTLDLGNLSSKALLGPIDPETSNQILEAMDGLTNNQD